MGVSDMGDQHPPLGSKLSVHVDSMKDLAGNLKEDQAGFNDEIHTWSKPDREEHPMNAQIGRFEGFGPGVEFREANFQDSMDAQLYAQQIATSVMLLQIAADTFATLYKSEDALSNVSLKNIQEMFPDKPFDNGGGNGGTPPLDKWKLIGDTGWDTDGDGDVDVYMPGSKDASQNPGAAQKNVKTVKDVDGKTHVGYDDVFNTLATHNGTTSVNEHGDHNLSINGQQNLQENTPVILAPGEFDGGQSTGGGSTSSTGTLA